MILARGDQVQPTSPLVPLLRPQPCVYNGIGINVMQSIDKQATFTQARTEPGHLGSAARTSNRKRNQPKILPCTSNKDKMQERAKSFQRHLSFCMGFSRMVKPLADFGYKYIGQSFGNEQIQCDECLMKRKIPNVFKQNTRQVVWHHLGCPFSSAKKPCTKCVQPNTGLCRGCEECQ